MKPNPFAMPGSHLFKAPNATPTHKEVFVKTPSGGGGGAKKKAPRP